MTILNFNIYKALVLFQVLLSLGCSQEKQELKVHYEFSATSISNAAYTPEQVISIAQHEATSFNYNTNDFLEISVYFDPEDEKEWYLFFRHNAPAHVGADISILVDDQTGKAKLFRGM